MASSPSRDDEVTDIVRLHWNARAARFDQEPGHGLHSDDQRNAWLDLLARLGGNTPQRVLDIGCGTGFLALLFAELGHTAVGVDLAADMLRVARHKAKQARLDVAFRLENAASLSDSDQSYDIVVARHVLWTMPHPGRAVTEWLRVLRPGGRLILIEGKWASHEGLPEAPRQRRTVLTLARRAAAKIVPSWLRATLQPLRSRKPDLKTYRRIAARLPFSGGPPAPQLLAFLKEQGLRNLTLEPLMNPVLWGEVPKFDRYVVIGKR